MHEQDIVERQALAADPQQRALVLVDAVGQRVAPRRARHRRRRRGDGWVEVEAGRRGGIVLVLVRGVGRCGVGGGGGRRRVGARLALVRGVRAQVGARVEVREDEGEVEREERAQGVGDEVCVRGPRSQRVQVGGM